jgi:hypothetical protein
MKKMITLMICSLLLLAAGSAQALVVSNSSAYLNESTPSADAAISFEPFAGLGTISRTYSAAGSYNILAFIDNDLDLELTGFYPEIAAAQGSFDDRFSYQAGDPFDIIGNFAAGALDNSVSPLPGDVAVAMAWKFDLLAGQTAQVSFSVSDVLPLGPGYLSHHDAVLLEPDYQLLEFPESAIYYVSSLRIEDTGTNPIPEPSTFLLFGSALAAFGVYARRRRDG